ncbi:MAG: hypothetical protein K2L90_04900 [Muribaculaceae bacterium]|nr:hypothetical protein [Muribaculaceae bacterium]
MGGYRVRAYLAVLAWLPAIPAPATTPRDMLPDHATIELGYTNRDSVETRLSGSALHPIEGIWQMTGDGAVIAIEQSQPYTAGQTLASGYRIVLIQSPCRRIRPGTIMGYATQSAKSGRYDAAIYASVDDNGILHRKRRFTLELHDTESRLAFIRHRADLRIDLRRLIPYLFRVSIATGSDRPRDMDGAIRLFPVSDAVTVNPRYL